MNTTDILTKLRVAFTGSEFESEFNSYIQNPDFRNIICAVMEIYESVNMMYPKPVIEKHSMRASIRTMITNHPVFQTEFGVPLQRIYVIILISLMEHITMRKFVKTVLKAFDGEFSDSQIRFIKRISVKLCEKIE